MTSKIKAQRSDPHNSQAICEPGEKAAFVAGDPTTVHEDRHRSRLRRRPGHGAVKAQAVGRTELDFLGRGRHTIERSDVLG